ncbi:MAG: hypothetical protein SV062_06670 [Thermodesulfobacteriota bacterium]|nr:hypothetical protein [Thermodesulfobacteriota bacterium]
MHKVTISQGTGVVRNLNYADARKLAFYDAVSNIIERAVETITPMENKVKNYLLLKEHIYPRALEYINRYKYISEKWDKRYYKVIIQAHIDLESLKKDLIKIGIATKR